MAVVRNEAEKQTDCGIYFMVGAASKYSHYVSFELFRFSDSDSDSLAYCTCSDAMKNNNNRRNPPTFRHLPQVRGAHASHNVLFCIRSSKIDS